VVLIVRNVKVFAVFGEHKGVSCVGAVG